MTAIEQKIKRELDHALKALPADKMAEVLDFVIFLKKRCIEEQIQVTAHKDSGMFSVRVMPASHLDRLTGMVEWGGNAFDDSERLYDAEF